MNTTNSNSGSEYSRKGRSHQNHQSHQNHHHHHESRAAAKLEQQFSRHSLDSTSDVSEQRLAVRNRRKAQKIISDPLSIGKDPHRESIGGASAPSHLRNALPLRVLPEVKSELEILFSKALQKPHVVPNM